MVTFDAESFSEISALENKSIKWTVQYSYADGSTKSQKIQSVGNSISLKATANMTVTAIVADETADETVTNYTVKFYNIYNNVVDFTYITEDQLPEAKEYTGSQIKIGDYTYTPDVPFYTLSGFKVSAPNVNKVISVYPEAHIWPKYNQIREFPKTSFHYPVKLNAPCFAKTTVYKKTRSGKTKPVIYLDGPFYPNKDLPMKEAQIDLRNRIYNAMVERAKKENSELDYRYEYIKVDSPEEVRTEIIKDLKK